MHTCMEIPIPVLPDATTHSWDSNSSASHVPCCALRQTLLTSAWRAWREQTDSKHKASPELYPAANPAQRSCSFTHDRWGNQHSSSASSCILQEKALSISQPWQGKQASVGASRMQLPEQTLAPINGAPHLQPSPLLTPAAAPSQPC